LGPLPNKEQPWSNPPPSSPDAFSATVKVPQVRFKDLEEVVTTHVRLNLLPFEVKTSIVRATEFSDWVSLTLQFQKRDLAWKQNDGAASVDLQVFVRVLTLTGKVAATVEDEIKKSQNGQETSDAANGILQFSRSLALPSGRYRLDIAVHDVNADKMGTRSRGVMLPAFYADGLETSPLILADQIYSPTIPHLLPVSGELYIGDMRIHPRVSGLGDTSVVFHPGERLDLFLQAYNLSVDPNNGKSDATIAYKLVNTSTGKLAIDAEDKTTDLQQFGEQITARKSVSLANIPKGTTRSASP
jgi:hypothetical protein